MTDDITELVKRVRRAIGARFPLAWGQQKPSGSPVMWPAVFDREGDLVAYCNTDEIQEAVLAIPDMLNAIERLQAERDRLREALCAVRDARPEKWAAASMREIARRALAGDDHGQ